MKTIYLTVGETTQRKLTLSDSVWGYSGEHNITTLSIIQPTLLDEFSLQAEFELHSGEKCFVTVADKAMFITNDITKTGIHKVQLVYYNDAGEEIAKSSKASFTIKDSINADVDSSGGAYSSIPQLEERMNNLENAEIAIDEANAAAEAANIAAANATSIYEEWNGTDVSTLKTSIDETKLSTTVWAETSTSSTIRTVTIDNVTSWDDVLNIPLFIRSNASGVVAATTLNINGLGAKPIVVANLPLWTYAYHVYNVTWNGEALIVNNPNIPAASTTQVGKVQLNDTVSSTSTTQAATANSVKMAYDTAQPEISNYYDSSTGATSVVTKYNTGIMIITQTVTVTRDITSTWGSLYNATSYIGFPDYPVAFIEVWHRNVSPSGGGAYGYWVVSDHMNVAPSLTNVGAYQVARPSSTSSLAITLKSFTIGTWKEPGEE